MNYPLSDSNLLRYGPSARHCQIVKAAFSPSLACRQSTPPKESFAGYIVFWWNTSTGRVSAPIFKSIQPLVTFFIISFPTTASKRRFVVERATSFHVSSSFPSRYRSIKFREKEAKQNQQYESHTKKHDIVESVLQLRLVLIGPRNPSHVHPKNCDKPNHVSYLKHAMQM